MLLKIILWALLGFVVLAVIPMYIIAPIIVYTAILVRTGPKKWARGISQPKDPECCRMFDLGMEWAEQYGDAKTVVSIENEGFRLAGEYFDFGADRAVIVIPGRAESLWYSYYFAEPFRAAGWNVLVIDNRSHGLSEGRFNSLGVKEYSDVIAWAKYLHDDLHNTSVLLHGVCVGSAAALYTLTSDRCPDYVLGMVGEGMFATFEETFKYHLISDHRPSFPNTAPIVMLCIRLFSGCDAVHDGPIYRIDRLKKPILFLHSREDQYSMPARAVDLYEKCSAPKTLVWFDRGRHSRIRINNTQAYDDAIIAWLGETFPDA